MERSNSGWIETYRGRRYWPLDPRPEDVDIEDIAHALALKCRFSGHCLEFYSVAEHSVRCSVYLQRKFPDLSKECYKWALMHDSGEYTTADVARPIKKSIPIFKEIEEKNMEAIAKHFNLSYPMSEEIEEMVKLADNAMLMTERRDLMAKSNHPWVLDGQNLEDKEIIVPWRWQVAETAFMVKYRQLFDE